MNSGKCTTCKDYSDNIIIYFPDSDRPKYLCPKCSGNFIYKNSREYVMEQYTRKQSKGLI